MKSLFYCFGLMLFSVVTKADEAIAWLSQQPSSGHFVQQKYLKVLSRPFISKGVYQYTKTTGLNWHTQHPVDNNLLIDANGVSELQPDGSMQNITSDKSIGRLLLALFSSDQALLKQQFKLEQAGNCVQLIPINTLMKKLFVHIDVCHTEQQSQSITLHENGGNRTEITLLPDSSPETKS